MGVLVVLWNFRPTSIHLQWVPLRRAMRKEKELGGTPGSRDAVEDVVECRGGGVVEF